MRDLREIAAVRGRIGVGGPAVLATVVKVRGSAYRGPGARLVVFPDDSSAGSVSAGCLERDVVAHAERVRETARAQVIAYDLSADDGPFGIGMRCGGNLELLLEPYTSFPGHLAFLLDAAARRESAVLVTVFGASGADAPPLGARLLLGADGTATGATTLGAFADAALADARTAMAEGRTGVRKHAVPGGEVEVLVEFAPAPIRLVLCGDEREAGEIARLAERLGWDATIVGQREEPPTLDARSAAVVMTHLDARDAELLPRLLTSPAPYVGLLGSRSRTARVLDELRASGALPGGPPPESLRTPAGLDLGAETPAEVALAIVAEIQAVFAGHGGGPLRASKGRIHAGR